MFFAPEGFLYDDVIKTTLLQVVLFLKIEIYGCLLFFFKASNSNQSFRKIIPKTLLIPCCFNGRGHMGC